MAGHALTQTDPMETWDVRMDMRAHRTTAIDPTAQGTGTAKIITTAVIPTTPIHIMETRIMGIRITEIRTMAMHTTESVFRLEMASKFNWVVEASNAPHRMC